MLEFGTRTCGQHMKYRIQKRPRTVWKLFASCTCSMKWRNWWNRNWMWKKSYLEQIIAESLRDDDSDCGLKSQNASTWVKDADSCSPWHEKSCCTSSFCKVLKEYILFIKKRSSQLILKIFDSQWNYKYIHKLEIKSIFQKSKGSSLNIFKNFEKNCNWLYYVSWRWWLVSWGVWSQMRHFD